MTGPLRVCVTGAAGRMGRESARALLSAGIEVAALVDPHHAGEILADLAGSDYPSIPIDSDLAASLSASSANVLLDFTQPHAAAENARVALSRGIAVVMGTSGITPHELGELAATSAAPVLLVPNFAIGAVLMMRFSEMAAKWMPQAEILEMHHDQKLDAPSGTAMRTAARIAGARGHVGTGIEEVIKIEGARGARVEGIPVHSVRLQGLVAHQMVMFGGQGETLTIRHDSLDRKSFMPGVVLAVRRVWDLQGFHVGLESVMSLDDST